jgi:hypothetical protein
MVRINVRRRIDLMGPTQVPQRVLSSPIIKVPILGAESLGVSRALTDQLRDTMEKIFNKCHAKDHYFIVVKCNLLPGRVIQNKVIIVNTEKTPAEFEAICKTFNTMCFYVDNRKGTIDPVWILPQDTVLNDDEISGASNKGSDRIARSAEGMPLL